jgi:Arc/MetJ-type ribon-helix-helix transcriptional regulator
MSDPKARLTVTVDPAMVAYAEELVRSGRASSVSAVFNDAIAARAQADREARRAWAERTRGADPAKVERMLAHAEAQAAGLPAPLNR